MINRINNCRERTITGSFKDVGEMVDFVKYPPEKQIGLVQKARSLERKSKEYNYIKVNQLPAVAINFNFSNGYIIGKNVSETTGYLYIDVDNMTEEDLEINTTYVCAYWRSLSNTGMTLVVRVDGLTPDNYKEATEEIATALDIPYDKQAVSIDRLTVLSYDPNAYYNAYTEVFPVSEFTLTKKSSVAEKSTHSNIILDTVIGYDYNGNKLRFDNLNELLESCDIVYDENGLYDFGKDNKLEYSKVYIPFRKIIEGERESKLKSIAYQLIALNKSVDKGTVLKYLYTLNYGRISPPLEKSEVEKTVAKVYNNIREIKPFINAKRRFVYDSFKELTTTQKRILNLRQIHKDTVSKTKSELWEVMENWNFDLYGKMTIKKVAEVTGKNKKTVQKYYSDLKTQLIPEISKTFLFISTKNKIFKAFVERNPLLKDLDDLMVFDFNS